MATELTVQNIDKMGRGIVLKSMRQAYGTGSAAINHTYTPDVPVKIIQVTLAFSEAPTTSEDFEITLDSARGTEYDTLVYSVDPSAESATAIIQTEQTTDLPALIYGDNIIISYANTDTKTWALTVLSEAL
jgi:hypothetical protein